MDAAPSPIGSVDVHLEPETHIGIDVDPDEPSGHADVFTIDIGRRPGQVVLFFHDAATARRMQEKLGDLADAIERIDRQRDALLAGSL